ncbi:fibronectin type III domain-containing protein [Modestobacter sp. I12A-02662]|uniref:fibronectin type III domain-containing protein n=1 Tax=Modestobacter sp. I12A-02662 TaxID=1730496 RepID=UPI0034DECCA0
MVRGAHPGRRGLTAVLLGLAVLLAGVSGLDATSAAFTATTSNPGNTLATDRLEPPGSLTVSPSCSAPGIAVRGATTAVGTETLTLRIPAGTVQNDVLVAQVAYTGTKTALTAPAGWSQVLSNTNAPTLASVLYVKVAGTAEPDPTFAFPAGSGAQLTGGIAAYSGVSTTDPVDARSGFIANSTTVRPKEVTTTSAGTMVLSFVTVVGAAFNAPPEVTERWRQDNVAGLGVTATDEQFAGPGVTEKRAFTSPNGTTTNYVAQTVALRRGPAAPPSALVSWTPTPSSWAQGYRIERQAGTAPPVAQSLPLGTTSSTDSPLTAGTTYTYRLWAYRGGWTSEALTVTATPTC